MSGVAGWTETIAARITAPGKGAVAVVRISGSKTVEILNQVAAFLPPVISFRHAYYGSFSTGDDGLVTVFNEGASFTGELSAELSGHGSPVAVQRLLEAIFQAGARPAEPGEFSLRAFLNGQIDLSQAEGIRETVDAVTDRQLIESHRLREGRISQELEGLLSAVRHALTTVEALTDFSEELDGVGIDLAIEKVDEAKAFCNRFLATQPLARQIREGMLVVLAGQPNAGKSSLLNALIKEDRAIVTPIPGTTRDSIEERLVLDGIPIRIVDTAGLRESGDEVEQLGIARTQDLMEQSDLILYLFDGSLGWTEIDQDQWQRIENKAVLVATKSDLGQSDRGIGISALTGCGLPELISALKQHILVGEPASLVERHYEIMEEVRTGLSEARTVLSNPGIPDDLASVSLRSALRKIGELTGESAPADVLEQIFSQFCIGK
ncbi:tRNA uridine-5-carboxymethylaminomethyl(34) synthesis GTPase MnmE [Armatimonadetes bacterium Uphvl-Ar1]|nr:tRNA uridine-5-carboxymethylaminomethyl(34) synthesis GTPase MnmE [Armatimonadetes bacterium Uphvl-Ar1]